MKKSLDQLEKKLGVKWSQPQLLAQALVHRSYLNEVGGESLASNERLEFLGDAVLSFTVSNWLYTQFPDYKEGELTNLRSNLVRTSTLAKISQELGLGENLLMSRGEIASGGRENPSLLANTLEAVIGAIFLDQGIDQTSLFIKNHLTPYLEKIVSLGEFKDSKSLLQEKIQEKNKETPIYKTLAETGPDHDKTFTVGVYAQGQLLAQAKGKNKQEAEENAAKKALEIKGLKS
jgi:ribonuclease-3